MNFDNMLSDMRNIYVGNAPYASGNMSMRGARFIETEHFWQISYDLQAVPYTYEQNEGFTHWISGKRVEKNKGFINVRIENELQQLTAMRINGDDRPYAVHDKAVQDKASTNNLSRGVIDAMRGDFNV